MTKSKQEQELDTTIEPLDAEVDAFEFDFDEEAIINATDPEAVPTDLYQIQITKAVPGRSKEDAVFFPLSRRVVIGFKIINNMTGDLDQSTLYKRFRYWLRLPSKQMRADNEYFNSVNNELKKFLKAIGMTLSEFTENIINAQEEAGGASELWGVEGAELTFLHEGVCSAYLKLESTEKYGDQNSVFRFDVS